MPGLCSSSLYTRPEQGHGAGKVVVCLHGASHHSSRGPKEEAGYYMMDVIWTMLLLDQSMRLVPLVLVGAGLNPVMARQQCTGLGEPMNDE